MVFAFFTAVLLTWMAIHVRRRGGFGSKTSAVLRTLSPVLLGLGGWFLAVLVVLVIWPAAFVGSQLLAVVSIGIPVGLGIYLAWVSRETNYVGFAAAMSGAIFGAWLGFNAGEDLLALLTTLIGAAITANLVLIVLDILWDRSGRARISATRPE